MTGLQAPLPCIRCGECVAACPAGLYPLELDRAVRRGDIERLRALGLMRCTGCGACDRVCPSAIPLHARLDAARAELVERDASRTRAHAARARFEARNARLAREAEEQARERATKAAANASKSAVEAALARARAARRGSEPGDA